MDRTLGDITNFIFMCDAPQPSDVIFLPGSSQTEHILCAARLYHMGLAPYILPSGKFSYKHGHFLKEKVTDARYIGDYDTEFAFCKAVLTKNGVPASAILEEANATNTFENAAFSVRVLSEKGMTVKRALLCCQAFHARRAFMTYGCYFPDCELRVIPSDSQGITKENWYQTEHGFSMVMGELAKCGKYFRSCQEMLKK